MSDPSNGSKQPLSFLFEYSVFLVVGALAALIWANVAHQNNSNSYQEFVKYPLANLVPWIAVPAAESAENGRATDPESSPAAADAAADSPVEAHSPLESEKTEHESPEGEHAEHGHAFDLYFLINDVLMALFFAIAAKEVLEALLPGGALSNPRKAATPVLATIGGVAGPAVLYMIGVVIFSRQEDLGNGWAVPCATDIAFSYLVARLIFGNGHPAIAFLLLLAIADDAAGLVILAIFYPSGELQLSWLMLTVAAIVTALVFRRLRFESHWWYLAVPGVMSWLSFYKAGIHPALGLVPVVAAMPHAHTDLGIFIRSELNRHDTLNAFEHFWKNPVEVILGLFGLVNAGVVMSNVGLGTWLVLVGLLVGKPVGILLFTFIGEKVFRLQIPGGMTYRHVLSLGMIAGIGFTVALFVSTAAFPQPGPIQDSVKMGALASFFAAVIAFVGSRMLGIKPLGSQPNSDETAAS